MHMIHVTSSIMKNEITTRFLEFHAGGDNKLQVNFVWLTSGRSRGLTNPYFD